MLFSSVFATLALCVVPSDARHLKRAVAVNASSLVVDTNVGSFQGQVSPVSSTVRQWLGIPYGKPTNGTRRFRPPSRASVIPSDMVFNATTYSPSCPQNRGLSYTGFNLITPLGNATDGEDCLSLNVWAPSTDRMRSNSSGAAVMIWVYGGAFTFGTSNTPGYQGDYIVRDNEDVIVVSINYRTNAFGFPAGSTALSAYDTNLGLRDQRMAVEWVYANIRQFGGDPERIIGFGESAGASSLGAYPYTYAADPILKGLILESGSEYLMASEAVTNDTLASIGWEYLATQVGCALNTTSNMAGATDLAAGVKQLQCLQALDFTKIQQVVSNYSLTVQVFVPKPDNVSVFTASQYTTLSDNGLYAPLPVLLGSNDNEGTILSGTFPAPADLITKYAFTCPAAAVAAARQNMSIPSWQYRYLGLWPSLNPYPAIGVYHSSEIALVFGTYNQSTVAPPTTQQIAFSKVMQGGWVAFATDPQMGLTRYGWPTYQANGTTLIQLAKNNMSMTTFNSSQAYNAGCAGVPLI